MINSTKTNKKYRPPHLARKIIDLIKRELSIVDIAGEFTELRPSKECMIGACPFCDSNTDTFSVFLNDRSYYCKNCSREGDAFQFIMDIDQVSFRDAFKIILSRYCGL